MTPSFGVFQGRLRDMTMGVKRDRYPKCLRPHSMINLQGINKLYQTQECNLALAIVRS